ncbi:MAG: hypothetical protein H6576_09550 [Lewinellaceae bacterium]|nr:hypothetical protein [Saprospiraceae bacterium]MCB9343931.1 hypothetical protein [Lewinellaceae bacterium]
MKLRFDQQSVRFRLKKSDVDVLADKGAVEETIHFPQQILTYRLEINKVVQSISAFFANNHLIVRIPPEQALQWINTNEVGIYASVSWPEAEKILEILIEKDFPCKHGSETDNADTFDELSSQ